MTSNDIKMQCFFLTVKSVNSYINVYTLRIYRVLHIEKCTAILNINSRQNIFVRNIFIFLSIRYPLDVNVSILN